jgi:hypothetical protein
MPLQRCVPGVRLGRVCVHACVDEDMTCRSGAPTRSRRSAGGSGIRMLGPECERLARPTHSSRAPHALPMHPVCCLLSILPQALRASPPSRPAASPHVRCALRSLRRPPPPDPHAGDGPCRPYSQAIFPTSGPSCSPACVPPPRYTCIPHALLMRYSWTAHALRMNPVQTTFGISFKLTC